jgi:hypothetical protein
MRGRQERRDHGPGQYAHAHLLANVLLTDVAKIREYDSMNFLEVNSVSLEVSKCADVS